MESESAIKLLVVDDNEINRQFVHLALSHYVSEIIETDNGSDAIRLAQQHQPDVILMDIHMPQMNGVTAMQFIREQWKHPTAPRIIAFTADARTEECSRLLELGFDDFLGKPATIDSLLKTILPDIKADETRRTEHDTHTQKVLDDDSALSTLSQNREVLGEMRRLLGEELIKVIPQIDQLVAQKQFKEASDLTHRMIASAAYCGAKEMELCTRALDDALKNQLNPKQFPHTYIRFLEAADNITVALEKTRVSVNS